MVAHTVRQNRRQAQFHEVIEVFHLRCIRQEELDFGEFFFGLYFEFG